MKQCRKLSSLLTRPLLFLSRKMTRGVAQGAGRGRISLPHLLNLLEELLLTGKRMQDVKGLSRDAQRKIVKKRTSPIPRSHS